MTSISSFARRVPRDLLGSFLAQHSIVLPELGTAKELVDFVEEELQHLPPGTRARLLGDIETIERLTSESGEVVMKDVTQPEEVEGLQSRHARALWLYLSDRDRFLKAEDMLYADMRRYGRMWNAFAGPKNSALKLDEASIERFKAALRTAFDTPNVEIEVYERTRPGFGNGDGDTAELTQVTIYREDRPNDERAFVEGALTTRTRRPVIEAAVTYEPSTGIIECVAQQRETRTAVATSFGSILVGSPDEFEPCAARAFDLTVLQDRCDFPTEPQDGIDDVNVTMLRLQPVESTAERITVENSPDSTRDIWTVVDERLGQGCLGSDYVISQARLVISYRLPTSNRKRRLPITITHPHRSNIREQSDLERTVSAKYLPRWRLVTA